MSDVGTLRFEMDAQAERATANLRLVAAAITAFGVIWLVAEEPGALGWFVAAVGALAAGGWIFAFRRSRRRADDAATFYLEVDGSGLTLAEGAQRHHIAWAEMIDVNVDEERLVVSVTRHGGPPLAIHPRYRGVSLLDLATAIRARRAGAKGHEMVK